MGGEALQLLRVLRLKDTIMEATMSKVFVEERKFHFIREIVQHDGFWDLLFAICQCWYPLFCLLRLADLAIGGMDKVKYYVCQMDRLLDSGLRNVLVKWRSADCPYYKLLLASTRKIDSRSVDSSRKTKVWMKKNCKMRMMKASVCCLSHHLFLICTQLFETFSL